MLQLFVCLFCCTLFFGVVLVRNVSRLNQSMEDEGVFIIEVCEVWKISCLLDKISLLICIFLIVQ